MKKSALIDIVENVLSDSSLNTDLSNHPSIVGDEDFNELEIFFTKYNAKYGLKLFNISPNTLLIKKEYQFISLLYLKIKSLSANKFEKISTMICKILHYENAFVTKASKDEGVDFIAFREDNDYLKTEEIIFGQCKHFVKKLVTVAEIRELAGAVTLFKMNEFMADQSYDYFVRKIKSHSSLKTTFVTSYFFSNESLKLCEKSGIVPLDIIDLMYLFVISQKQNIYKWTNDDLVIFDEIVFDKDIEEIKKIY